ncbi:MAG: hypothetical protein ACKV19_24945 [Verrucomicrobiales bacterium]
MPPTPPTTTPPSLLRRPGCWVTFLALVPLLIGGLYLTENIVGARRLARVTADLAAGGIELDPHKITPTRPPDDENFFATPFLAAIGAGSAHDPGMQAVRRMEKWEMISRIEPLHSAKPTDWTAVRDAIAAKDKQAGITPTDRPIADLLVSLDRDLTPIAAELTAALARPKSRLVPDFYDELRAGKDSGNLDQSWIHDVRTLACALALRGRLEIEAGNPRSVAETVLILLRLAEGVETDGATLGLLVANSVTRQAGLIAWLAADRRVLPRQVWVDWARAFSRPRPLELLPDVVRGEMITLQHGALRVRADRGSLFPGSFNTATLSYNPPDPWVQVAAQFIPRGWFDMNEAHALQSLSELIRHFEKPPSPDYFGRNAMETWIRPKIEPAGWLHHHLFARSCLGLYPSIGSAAASTQSLCRLAEVACALEILFRDRQGYPESLDALVPEFLPAAPVDFDARPIRYAQDPANGRYKIWSIGEDGVDDGGVEKMENPRPKKSPRRWSEPVGDWVWHYGR